MTLKESVSQVLLPGAQWPPQTDKIKTGQATALSGNKTGHSCSSGLAAVQSLRFYSSWKLVPRVQEAAGEVESLHGGPERPLHEAVKVKPKLL